MYALIEFENFYNGMEPYSVCSYLLIQPLQLNIETTSASRIYTLSILLLPYRIFARFSQMYEHHTFLLHSDFTGLTCYCFQLNLFSFCGPEPLNYVRFPWPQLYKGPVFCKINEDTSHCESNMSDVFVFLFRS